MKKCLFFFLGLIAALGLAVLTGLNAGEAKPQRLEVSLEAKATPGDGLASETPKKAIPEKLPENKVP
jgi:hypothetical protein